MKQLLAKQILRKLNNRAGETLVESMAAILVFTFASIIMMSMVSAAADINTTAKETDRKFQKQMVVVERGNTFDNPSDPTDTTDPHVPGTVTFNFNGTEESVLVDVFKATDGELYAYYEKAGGGT